MSRGFPIVALSYILALLGRISYDQLKRAGRIDPKNRFVFTLILLDMVLLWTAWFGLCLLDTSQLGLPAFMRRLGFVLTAAGLLLFILALLQLKRLENTTRLVTSGMFRLMRHPIYIGFACWYLGWPLFWDRQWSLFLGVASLCAVVWWRRIEEQALLVQFGQAYREYQGRTWF